MLSEDLRKTVEAGADAGDASARAVVELDRQVDAVRSELAEAAEQTQRLARELIDVAVKLGRETIEHCQTTRELRATRHTLFELRARLVRGDPN